MHIAYLCRLRVLETRYIYAVIIPSTKEYSFIFVDYSSGKNNDDLLKLARKTIKKDDSKIVVKFKST